MLQHFLAVGAAVAISLWSTVLSQYHDFKGTETVSAPVEQASVPEVTLAQPSSPTPLDVIVAGIVQNTPPVPEISATTTVQIAPATVPGPVKPTTPSVPFTPLPVPVIPTITAPATTTTPVTPVAPVVSAPEAHISDEALLRASIVNVICLPGGGLRGSSGSGVVIDSRGLILTVAHVGQNFLLRDYPTEDAGSCYIRTGSPAKNAYSAELVYVSPSWLSENETTFLRSNPKGTGEHDFALIAITGTLSGTALPKSFSHIPLAPANTDVEIGEEVGTGSYAAEFLSSSEVRSSLYPTIKFADVDDVFTFGRNTVDIFSVAAGSAAQEGSSGGAVMNEDGRLIGLITTRTVKPDLSLRTMQAITMDHLRRSFKADTGENMDSYLKNSIPTLIQGFVGPSIELKDSLFEAIEEASD